MAPRDRFLKIIEININNLAAVPSVVFRIMGLLIFGMPSIQLGISWHDDAHDYNLIACLIRAVPPSIHDATAALVPRNACFTSCDAEFSPSASFETAPLLMIGMVAFIVDVYKISGSPYQDHLSPNTVWADFAEHMFIQKTSAAVI